MAPKFDKYDEFAHHPRYGHRPNITGINPSPMDHGVHLHWNTTTHNEIVTQYQAVIGKKWPYSDFSDYSSRTKRIPKTAIAADLSQQTPATVVVTHYFDLERKCRDCDRWFIFFAQEQKYWYEKLGFGLESDCVRCVDCRKKQQEVARQRNIYESLFHVPNKTEQQLLDIAEACLSLIEYQAFTTSQTQYVRRLLNSIPKNSDVHQDSRYNDLYQRVLGIEKRDDPNYAPENRQ